MLAENNSIRKLAANQILFGSLELGIWILFVICSLVLEIFYIQRLNYGLDLLFDFFKFYEGYNTSFSTVSPSSTYARFVPGFFLPSENQ